MPPTVLYVQFEQKFQQRLDGDLLPASVGHVGLHWPMQHGEVTVSNRYGCRQREEVDSLLVGRVVRFYDTCECYSCHVDRVPRRNACGRCSAV